MRIESSVTSISWIPSEAIEGMPKVPFDLGLARYDEPPPDRIDDLEALRAAERFRAANELGAWIEVKDGEIAGHGYRGGGVVCAPRLALGSRSLTFVPASFPLLRREPEAGNGWVRFFQTAGGRIGLPAPRRVLEKPYFRIGSATAWTTLELTIHASGEARGSLAGASPFPRHWVYDASGRLAEKSGTIDFESWYRESFEESSPWGGSDAPALATAVESELERRLSAAVMGRRERLPRRLLDGGEALVEQGEPGQELFLLLDGLLEVEVDGRVVAQVGPGAMLGERAALKEGRRTATLRAVTPCRVVVVPAGALSPDELAELAALHRREEGGNDLGRG